MDVKVFVGTIERKDPETKKNELISVTVNADQRLCAMLLFDSMKAKLYLERLPEKFSGSGWHLTWSSVQKKLTVRTKDGVKRSIEDPIVMNEVVDYIIENCQGGGYKTYETAKPYKKCGLTVRMWAR